MTNAVEQSVIHTEDPSSSFPQPSIVDDVRPASGTEYQEQARRRSDRPGQASGSPGVRGVRVHPRQVRVLVRALLVLGPILLLCSWSVPASSAPGQTTTFSWGRYGERGTVSGPIVTRPTAVANAPANVVQVVTTNSATYELTSSGAVWAWGAGSDGELGNGTTPTNTTNPVQVDFPAGITIRNLPSPGPQATMLAIDTKGDVWGWGADQYGQLCLGSATQEDTPVELPLHDVTAATGAGRHASYVAGGTVYSCGDDKYGELGDGIGRSSMSPVAVDLSNVVALYSGWEVTGALTKAGDYYDWGFNALGQLGNGSTTNAGTPQLVESGVVQAAVGGDVASDGQTLVLLESGVLKGWGSDQYGQLCDGNEFASVSSPVTVAEPAPIASFASGGAASYLLDTSGNVWACGDDQEGQIGNGAKENAVVTPTEVLSGVTQVSSTSRNEVAIVG